MFNVAIIGGRLTADPELKKTKSDISMLDFTVACQRNYKPKDAEKYETDFIKCRAWREKADFIVKYFHKGDQIAVIGANRAENYEKDGEKKTMYFVDVTEVHFMGSKGGGNADGKPKTVEMQTGNVSAFFSDMQDIDVPIATMGQQQSLPVEEGDEPPEVLPF